MLLPLISTDPDKPIEAPPPDSETLLPLIEMLLPTDNEPSPALIEILLSDIEIELSPFLSKLSFLIN